MNINLVGQIITLKHTLVPDPNPDFCAKNKNGDPNPTHFQKPGLVDMVTRMVDKTCLSKKYMKSFFLLLL